MYNLLLRIMLAAAALQLSLDLARLGQDLTSKEAITAIETASRRVLNIEWKPIVVFPEETERFR